jgi:hypothetical protein
MTPSTLYAGADACSIQPSLDKPVYLAGFTRNRTATGTHDPLMVRTLALSDGVTTAVLAVCDLLGLARADTLDIRAWLNLPPSTSVVIACTHTHSGADTIGLWGPDEATTGCDDDYIHFVKRQVVAAVRDALSAMQPATLRAAMVAVPGIVRNFRDPHIVDHELAVLQARAEGGNPIFTLLNFPCHPEVMDDDNTLITADMAGFACRAVERSVGGVGVWASAHLGGMMSPNTTVRTFAECQRLGERLGAAALRAVSDTTEMRAATASTAGIRIGSSIVVIPLQNPLLQIAAANGLLRAGEQGDVIPAEVSVWQIGELAQFAFVPGELLPALGLQLKAAMTARAKFVIGLANDELGYILPRDAFVLPEDYLNPGQQYEESMSIGPEAGPLITDALIALLCA